MSDIVFEKTKLFVKDAFRKNPHYSFGDFRVMYEHSLRVFALSLEIAKEVKCDCAVVGVGALLHDIGKTHLEDEAILHTKHESYNLVICEDFLNTLSLSSSQIKLLKEVVSYSSSSDELKIVQDADAIALYYDKRLYMLYIEWAAQNNLWKYIHRKIDKFKKLHFDISRQMGRKWLEDMMHDWEPYLAKDEKTSKKYIR